MKTESYRMMGLAEAKAHLSALIAAVEAGESICLTRRSKPVATVSPFRSSGRPAAPAEGPIDLDWLQRIADAMPIGTADDAALALDVGRYVRD